MLSVVILGEIKMKKKAICLLVSASLIGCSSVRKEVVIESKTPIGAPYLAEHENGFSINEPKVTFDNDVITITPNIVSSFTQYQDFNFLEVTTTKYISPENHFGAGTLSIVSLGIAPFFSIFGETSLYPCTGEESPYNNPVKCNKASAYTEVDKFNIGKVDKDSYIDNENLSVSIEADGVIVDLPLSEDNLLYTTLEELNNPSEFTVVMSYKGETEEFDIAVPVEDYEVSQSILANGFIISNANSLPFGNTSRFRKKLEKETFKRIRETFDDKFSRYLASVKKPISPKSKVFPDVPQPTLPPAPVLTKSQFETKAEFQVRVESALDKRNVTIEKLQMDYRFAVEKRNTALKTYLAEREANIAKMFAEYNQRREQLKNTLDMMKIKQTAYAFKDVLGSPYLDNAIYDAETQTMYGTVKMTRSEYQEKISFNVPSTDAKFIYENQQITPLSLTYQIVGAEVKLSHVSVSKDDSDYLAKVDNTEYKSDDIRVVINTNKKLINEKQLQGADLLLASAGTLQNPNLTDEYSISAVTFVRNQEMTVGEKAFNDDIPTLLKNTKQREVSKKRWLFAVGIENYQQTDDIQYSRRSAELFVQVAQKKLGISKRNTYSLIDEQATVGQIKDRMSLMLRNVQEGDEIYFYYNGHGIPDAQDNNEPYLLASDKIPDFVTDDPYFKLENFYQQLTNSNANKVVAFVDSCFSGATDGVAVIKGVAASRLAPKRVSFDQNKMVVLTAGKKKQYSNVYLDKGNRLFSYFVMKDLLKGKRDISEVYQDVRKNVRATSLDMGDLKLQEPSLSGNKDISI